MPTTVTHDGHAPANHEMPQDKVGSATGKGATAIDPVCGMTVTLKPVTRTETFDEKSFHFCSEKCQTKFKADPWFYASGRAPGRKKAAPANVQ